jgi:hypothetical protein
MRIAVEGDRDSVPEKVKAMQHPEWKLKEAIRKAVAQVEAIDFEGACQAFDPVLDQLCWDNGEENHPSFSQIWLPGGQPIKVLRCNGFASTSVSSCVAAGWHTVKRRSAFQKTMIGNWVYHSKVYSGTARQTDEDARSAAIVMLTLLRVSIPEFSACDYIVAATSSNASRLSLPESWSAVMSRLAGVDAPPVNALFKTRSNMSMKNFRTLDEKRKGILKTMKADRQTFQGKKVLVIDDILDSGYTVREAARALREAQAAEVHVVTLTKTHDFLDQTLGTRHG